jgi:dipeptidyl-peptidase-4
MLPTMLLSLLATTPAVPPDTFLRQYAETHGFANGLPTAVRPTADGRWVLFLRSEANSRVQSLFAFEVATGKTREVLTAESLLKGAAQKLSVAERAQLERKRISARGFTGFELSDDGKTLVTVLSGRIYLLDVGALTAGKPVAASARPLGVEGALTPRLSADGKQLGYVKDWDLHVLDVATGRSRQLTTGGTERLSHGLAEFVAQEEMARFDGFWWAPDGHALAYEESDTREVETFTIQDPARPEQPANTFPYPRPGKANAKVRLGIVASAGGATTWVTWDRTRYPYLTRVVWPKKGPLTVLVENRAQTEEVLLSVEPASGATQVLLTESDSAWLNLPPAARVPTWLEDGSGFFWLTERTGAWSAEFHAPDGKLVGTWMSADEKLVSLLGYDAVERALYFLAAPQAPDTVVMRAREKGRAERVFPAVNERTSELLQLSDDAAVRVLTTPGPDGTPRTEVKDRTGKTLGLLPSVATPPPFVPHVEYRQVGARGFWTTVVRPRTAVPGQKLPVLVDCYGGPHANVVQANPVRYLLEQWQADQGFLVVGFDGRGTPRRGRLWERAIKDDFSGVILDDQVAALQALAAVVPEMDLSRVGIAGWSFGGYLSALAVLKRPDVFHASVAGAPVVDWLDYDTYYTERYLGIPPAADAVYARNGLLGDAPNLQRPLLLLHGTSDDNVYFFHSLKLANALFRAGRQQFQFLPLSGFTHMVADPVVLERLQRLEMDFLKGHLLQPATPVATPAKGTAPSQPGG